MRINRKNIKKGEITMGKLLGKKKLINSIELIIQAILFISVYVIQSVEMTYHSYSYNSTTNGVAKTSLFGFGVEAGNGLVYIFIGLMLVNIILCLVSIFGNATDRDGKSHIVMVIVNIIFGGLVLSISYASGYDTVSINPIYKIFVFACLIAIFILAVIKRSSLVVPKVETQPQQVINNIQETSNADELKKYKDLLDSGVITQEEFDEKKKQLLGL